MTHKRENPAGANGGAFGNFCLESTKSSEDKTARGEAQAHRLYHGRSKAPLVEVVPDDRWPGMHRVRWPDRDTLSPPANLTRCRDAARAWAEAEVLRKNRRQRALKSLENFSWSAFPVRQVKERAS